MKKIKLPDLFKIRKRKECKTNNLRETMELLARVVDDKLYVSMMDLGMEREYATELNRIWDLVEDEAWDDAKEVLYSLAVLLDDDAKFILEHMVYPKKDGIYYFFDYFCEYLADGRIIDYQIYKAGMPKEFVDIDQIPEKETKF